MGQTEQLFNAMLERLMQEKRLTVKAITQEVSHLLSVAGMAEPKETEQSEVPARARTLPVRAVLTNFQRIPMAQLTAPELSGLVTMVQAQIRLAKARLKELTETAEPQ